MKKLIRTLLGLTIVLAVSSCLPPNPTNAVGTYKRQVWGVSETLSLQQNGVFQQTLVYPDGNVWTNNGKWSLEQRALKLEDGYYYCINDDDGKLLNPPAKVGFIRFQLEQDQLSREMQPPLKKSP